MIRNTAAIFKKQWKDTLKNKTVLVQFVMFPCLAIIMTYAINIADMPKNYFVQLFSIMYIGMTPLTGMTAILSEEKEKNTLKALFMSNVSAPQYLLAVGGYLFLICMAGSLCFALISGYHGVLFITYLAVMAIGILASLIAGAVIGILSKNQMSATSLTVPVMLILSFLPMLSMFNETIGKFSKFIFTQQVYNIVLQIESNTVAADSIIIIAVNFFVLLGGFVLCYRKYGLKK